jgi:hypothetical protein
MQSCCHPEQAFFAQRGIWASRAKRRVFCDALLACLARFPIHFAGPFCPSGGAAGLANLASSTGTFSFTSLT